MKVFMIKIAGLRFYVHPWPVNRFAVIIDGEEVVLETDEDGFVRAALNSVSTFRHNMQLLNKIASAIENWRRNNSPVCG
ncbi:hypothetical protein DVR12_03320 [Chitinophaga silvatica]|uniref:Uncharacterized protein n=1 Tax=Chitinophaga silvatica TaxID=2282649 RepID=A0A3E1YHG1_9BACT|nr:hypothetical protein [Chitinophaga silvatica]RFS26829.1 hypothetical protein DVR12_03320 [Chitinophaga silvatica]